MKLYLFVALFFITNFTSVSLAQNCNANAGTIDFTDNITVCYKDNLNMISISGFTNVNEPYSCIAWGFWVMDDPLGVFSGHIKKSDIGAQPSGNNPYNDPNFAGFSAIGNPAYILPENNGVTYCVRAVTLANCKLNPPFLKESCFDVSDECLLVYMNKEINIQSLRVECDDDVCENCLEYSVQIFGGDAQTNGTTFSVDINVNETIYNIANVKNEDIITIGDVTNPNSTPKGLGKLEITATDAIGCLQKMEPSGILEGGKFCGNTCGSDAGTLTVTITGKTKDAGIYNGSDTYFSTSKPFILCFTDGIEIMSNMDFTEPPTGPYPGMSYSINEGFPVEALLDQDPKWTGVFWTGELTITSDPYLNNTYQNTMHLIRTCFLNTKQYPYSSDPNDFPDNTIYYVPFVDDCIGSGFPCPNLDSNGDGCYDYNGAVGITYLNPIIAIGNQTCRGLELTFLGGYPEFYGGLYTIDFMSNGNPIAEDLTTGYGGKLLVEGLNYNETISIEVTDPQGCQQTMPDQNYFFEAPNLTFTKMDSVYCTKELPINLIANALPDTTTSNASYTIVIYRNSAPNQNSFEIIDANNTAVYTISGNQIKDYPINPENKAVFNTGSLPASGCPYTFKIYDNKNNGQANCSFNEGTGAYIIYDNISGQYWPPSGPMVGNWGASNTWFLGCPPDHVITASYTGAGINNNGNGTAFFDPLTAGIGVHTICYNLTYDEVCEYQYCQTTKVVDDLAIDEFVAIESCEFPFDLTKVPISGIGLTNATIDYLINDNGLVGNSIQNPTSVLSGTYFISASLNSCTVYEPITVKPFDNFSLAPIPAINLCVPYDLNLIPIYDSNGNLFLSDKLTFFENINGEVGNEVNSLIEKPGWYWINVTFENCNQFLSINITNFNDVLLPILPADTSICLGNALPASITAVGNNINWYSDVNLTSFLASGNTIALPNYFDKDKPGFYSIYATQSSNGCQSNAAAYNIIVLDLPNKPILPADTSICLGDALPASITAVGNNINWYSDVNLTSFLASGNTIALPNYFDKDKSGFYSIYATQSSNGCQSNYSMYLIGVLPDPIALFDVIDNGTGGIVCTNLSQNVNSDPLGKYIWNFGDGQTSSDINPTHQYAENGTYLVQLAAIACNDTSYFEQELTITTIGLQTNWQTNKYNWLTIYPKLVLQGQSFVLNYHCSTSIKTSAFTIFNIFGEVVYTQNNVLPNEIIQNNLPSGIYLCQLTLNYKQILTGKLIVI